MKTVYIALGSLFLALGMIGVFIPLLPTTPFLLLAAWMYCKSSTRLYGWLMIHPRLGPYIRNYRDKKALSAQGKALSIGLLWTTIVICIFYVAESVWLKVLLGAILGGVSWHILSFRTLRREEEVRFVRLKGPSRTERVALAADSPKSDLETMPAGTCCTVPATISKQEFYLIKADGREAGYAWIEHSGRCLRLRSVSFRDDGAAERYAGELFSFLEHYCRRHGIGKMAIDTPEHNAGRLALLHANGFEMRERPAPAETRTGTEKYCTMEKTVKEASKTSAD